VVRGSRGTVHGFLLFTAFVDHGFACVFVFCWRVNYSRFKAEEFLWKQVKEKRTVVYGTGFTI